MPRLRVLAIAFACDPTKGSEHGVGWGWVNAIAKHHDLTVITADFNAIHIIQQLGKDSNGHNIDPAFIYVTNLPWHYSPTRFWHYIETSIAKPLMNLAYHNWLVYAFRIAQTEIAHTPYDLIHLITYVGWRFPGRFYQLNIPFVWGPIGGLKNTPRHLLPILGLKGAVYYSARNLVNSLQLKLLTGPKQAIRAADNHLIAATEEIQYELRKHYGARSHVISEVGPPEGFGPKPKSRNDDEPLKICWSGEHLPGKALQLLLRAVTRLPSDIIYSIEILGDGPHSRVWRRLAIKLKIDEHCNWYGWLPRNRALALMDDSHLFVITSLKDLTSSVALEAISLGLPIITLNHCGFADLVNNECGIKIDIESASQIEYDIARSIATLYYDEQLRKSLSKGSLDRSNSYSWESKMTILNDVYSSAVNTH